MARKARASAATASTPVVSSIAAFGTRSKRKSSASVAAAAAPSMGVGASSSSPTTTTVNVSVASTPTASGGSSAISPALKKRRMARTKVNAIPFPALYGSTEVISVDDEDEDDATISCGYRILDVAAPSPVALASRQQLNYANAPPGPTVKPDFHVPAEFAAQARVLHQHGEYLDAMLTRACLYQNQNEFALLQVLDMPLQGFYVWSRTGVVGTAGDTVMEGPWPEAYEATARFRSLFLNKTLRHWDERHTQQHANGGFTWIETHQTIVGEEDQVAAAEAEAAAAAAAATAQRKRRSTKKSRARAPRKVKAQPLTEVRVARAALPHQATPPPSTLDEDVQSFLTMAIDAASVYSSASQRYYSYATAKQPTKKSKTTATTVLVPTPLGKLTKAAIEKGFEALHRLHDALKCDADRTALTMLSSHFFSLVPHPQLAVIDSMVRLMEKVEMLVALCVHSGYHELLLPDLTRRYFATNHLDATYNALKCRLMPLLPTSKEFGLVQAYIFNSYCCVGNSMVNNFGADGKLLTVFRVEKESEAARFAAYRTAPNRRVLWHGSRMSNWMGILKHGLLITPPGVPLNGSSLGAGLYFTDKISKAMAYSHASHDRQVFLLSEVALGSCKPSTTAVRATASATNVHHSCHGVGRCVPDSNGDFVDALGAIWPLGKATQTKDTRATHGHNEFVVFNTAQARMRYVVVTRPLY